MEKPFTAYNGLHTVVKVTHPDGHYFYGLTTNIQNYKFNLIRDYSAYKKSKCNPNSHGSYNMISWYGAMTNVSPKDFEYVPMFASKDKSLSYHMKKWTIRNAINIGDGMCLNDKVGETD